MFMNPKRHCTSVVNAVPRLIGVKKKKKKKNVANESFSRTRSTTTWAVIAHYAPPLEGLTYDQPTCNSREAQAYHRPLIPSLIPSPPPHVQLSSLAVYGLQATILIAVVEDWVRG